MSSNISSENELDYMNFVIPNSNLTYNDIYSSLSKEEIIRIRNLLYQSKDYYLLKIKGNKDNIKIFNITNDYIAFELDKEDDISKYTILIKPIKLRIQDRKKQIIEYNLICDKNFELILEKRKIQSPFIFKREGKAVSPIELGNYLNYLYYYKKNSKIFIIDTLNINMLNNDEFNLSFDYDMKGFLGRQFNKPTDFEPNYFYYFNERDKIEFEKYKIINSKERTSLCHQFLSSQVGYITKYFGQQAMGKSISLIGAIKYMINHNFYGTLYINCKALFINYNNNLNNNLILMKQILIDEIFYLFKNHYDLYKECYEEIKKYIPKDGEDFWTFINIIFKFIKRDQKKIYIICFDQYNDKIDKNNILENYIKESKNVNISIITLSSMNNKDIKQYKNINLSLTASINNKITYLEVKDFIPKTQLKINDDDENYTNALDYLGIIVNNYNVINYYFKQKLEIQPLIDKKKEHIKAKILDYYNINDIKKASAKNIYNILSFSVNSKYKSQDFKNKEAYIPYKYFDIKINFEKEQKQSYIKLEYRFPVIEDIFNEFYSSIIMREDFFSIYSSHLDEGAKGTLFEKAIIHHLTPNSFSKEIDFFGLFMINDKIKIKKYIPNSKENNLKPKTIQGYYIIIQEQFGGKMIDMVIIEVDDDNKADAFCFQITIYKKKEDLLNLDILKKNFNIMILFFKNYFTFDIASIYFCYIFDYLLKDDKKQKNMHKNVLQNKLNYFFYDVKEESFKNDEGNSFNIMEKLIHFKYGTKKGKKPKFDLNEFQKETIREILKENNVNKNYKITFINTQKFFFNKILDNHFLITEYDDIDSKEKMTVMIYFCGFLFRTYNLYSKLKNKKRYGSLTYILISLICDNYSFKKENDQENQ